MTFLFVGKIFDITQILSFIFVFIFFDNLNSINFNGWMAILITSIRFIFLENLGLRLIRISKRKIVRFSLVFISVPVFLTNFIFFFFG